MNAYTDRLRAELAAAGIRGRLRARIIDEITDHLDCDPAADLGAPRLLARQFADELGTLRVRRAALRSFAALALAGLLFGVTFADSPSAAFGAAPAGIPLLAQLARIGAVLAPQIAFVAGLLAALRALHRRRAGVIAAAEARMIARRATVGTAFGVVSMACLGVIALSLHRWVPSAWETRTLIMAGVGVAGLLAVLPALWATARLRPVADGGAGDLFDDLGPVVPAALRGRPWRLATLIAAGVAGAIALAGVPGDDLYDGIARGVFDGAACLIGFATLGRYLGLWSPGGARRARDRSVA